jgi:hypothetical protein
MNALDTERNDAVQLEDETCVICFDSIAPSECGSLPCRHTFHFTCIKTWSEKSTNLCPLCKERFKAIRCAGGSSQVVIDKKQGQPAHVSAAELEDEEEDDEDDDLIHLCQHCGSDLSPE